MRLLEALSSVIISFFVLISQLILGDVRYIDLDLINQEASSSSQIATHSAVFNPNLSILDDTTEAQTNSHIQKSPTITATEKYQMEDHPSGEEGFYVLKNAPSEPMTTVEELNMAVINYRKAHGFGELYIDSQLCDIAHQRAIEANSEFSHAKFSEHVKAGDYNYTGFNTISENLWDGSFSGVHIVEFGWDRSPGHRANLQGDWTRGCGGVFKTTATYVFAN